MELSLTSKRTTLKTAQKYCATDITLDVAVQDKSVTPGSAPQAVTVVALPSVIRYWIREIQYKCKKPPKTDYDAIWFEGQATKSGLKYFERA